MQIPTNRIGLLIAAIESGGALRRAGDRVLVESGGERQETAWTARHHITRYQDLIADAVHEQHGIVANATDEQIECQLPDAFAALRAATRICRRRDAEMNHSQSTQSHIRLALGYGSLQVDGGRVSGPVLDDLRVLVGRSEGNTILATGALVARLPTSKTIKTHLHGNPDNDAEQVCFELTWEPQLRLENNGRSIVINDEQPLVKLGAKGKESARVWTADGRFYVSSGTTGTTCVVTHGGGTRLHHGDCEIKGQGKLGLNATTGLKDALELANFSVL